MDNISLVLWSFFISEKAIVYFRGVQNSNEAQKDSKPPPQYFAPIFPPNLKLPTCPFSFLNSFFSPNLFPVVFCLKLIRFEHLFEPFLAQNDLVSHLSCERVFQIFSQ